MSVVIKRKYGVATTIPFELFEVDGVDFRVDAVHASGDTTIMKDEGAETNTAAAFVDEGQGYSIALSDGEMEAARIAVYIADQTATKVWLDRVIYIETYGHASSQHAFDSDLAEQTVDVVKISGDATAADNLELMYDGAGYTDDTAPASRLQLAGVGAGSGGSINIGNTQDNIDGAIVDGVTFVGTETSGTNASVNGEDGAFHNITGAGTGNDFIDLVYQFDVGGGRIASDLLFAGYLSGVMNALPVEAWNGSTWDQIGTIPGQPGSSVSEHSFPLLIQHTGTGANLGKVFIRFHNTAAQTNPDLFIDLALAQAVNIGQSIGYADGAIWVDTVNGTAGVEAYVNGTGDHPVDSWADALTLSASVGIKRFRIISGSTITLSANSDGFDLIGDAWSLALGGQSIEGLAVTGAMVTGIGTATVTHPLFEDCRIGAATIPPSLLVGCGLGHDDGTFTAGSAGEYVLRGCYSMAAAAGAMAFVFSGLGAATAIHNRGWLGGATYTLDSNCELSHEVLAGGGTTVTTGGADVEIRGIMRSVTLILSSAGTVQFVGITGPITISGTTTATVNLYGVSSGVTDTSVTATVTDSTRVRSDVEAISGDKAAADALETMLDGTGGNKLTLSQLKIVAAGDDSAIDAAGSGNGHGFEAVGGTSANGIFAEGGSQFGIGISGKGGVSGPGIQAWGQGNYPGLACLGAGTAAGLKAIGGDTGAGIDPVSGGGAPSISNGGILASTTIATIASQTSFTLTAGSADDGAYDGATALIEDTASPNQKCAALISNYVGASKTVTLAADPGIFTIDAPDKVTIIAVPKSLPAALPDAAGGLPISDAGGVDLDQVAADVAATLVDTGTTLPATLAGMETKIDTVDTVVDAIVVTLGTPAGASIAADIANISGSTTNIILGAIRASADAGVRNRPPIPVELFQLEARDLIFTILDANDDAIDLSSMTLRFVVFDTLAPPVGKWKVEGGDIAVSGDGNNVATVSVDETDTATASPELYWILWDTVGKTALAHGPMKIVPGKFDA